MAYHEALWVAVATAIPVLGLGHAVAVVSQPEPTGNDVRGWRWLMPWRIAGFLVGFLTSVAVIIFTFALLSLAWEHDVLEPPVASVLATVFYLIAVVFTVFSAQPAAGRQAH